MSISRSLGLALVVSLGFGMSASAQVSPPSSPLMLLLTKNTGSTINVTPTGTTSPPSTPVVRVRIVPEVGCGPRG